MITRNQKDALSNWIERIAPYPPEADIIVQVTGVKGGQAEVRITPEGEVFSTTNGMQISVGR